MTHRPLLSGSAPLPDAMSRHAICAAMLSVAAAAIVGGIWTPRESAAALSLILSGLGLASLAAAGWSLARNLAHADITTRENAELRILLNLDPLTGLMNRSAFERVLDDPRLADHDMLLALFFDLDRFKEVNDALGHKVGDDLLQQVAERARSAIAEPVALARLGGDEFAAVIAWGFDSLPNHYGSSLVDALSAPYYVNGKLVEIGASVGLAMGDPTRIDGRELLRRADLAMYAAKASPDRRYRLFDDALDRRETRESSVRVELGRAIIEDTFALHYQPLVDARTGAFSSAEALLRPQSAGLRDVSPAAVVAAAERSGQIRALTDWTIETALAAAAKVGTAPIAVNISPLYFRQPEFVPRLLDKLLHARVRPDQFSIEITEGVLIENFDAARESVNRIREVGVSVFLDDFGTGYSSLSYLQHFELDGLKLDKSFLRNVGDRQKSNQIIRSMIDFGHSLDMRVVVEGVESDWQARLVQLLGCDLLQGYEIAMPMPLADLIKFRNGHSTAEATIPRPLSSGSSGATPLAVVG
jgi:diguanylate cyclase (GGDEF)-like protein